MRRLAIAAAILAACGLGFGLAQIVPSAAPPVSATTTVVERAEGRGLDELGLRALIRAAIRDELGAGIANRAADPPPSDTPAEPPAPSVEQVQQRQTADQIVASALASGVWREADRDAIQRLDQLAPLDWVEALRPLVIATNARRVKVEVSGPLFL